MTIFGIDPGLAACGWAVVAAPQPVAVASGVIRTSPKSSEPERVAIVADRMAELIVRHRPWAVALEAYVQRWSSHRASAGSHIQVARVVGALGQLCRSLHVPCHEYSAALWMRAIIGPRRNGLTAGEAVRRRLGLAAAPPEHAADAIGVALYHAAAARPSA